MIQLKGVMGIPLLKKSKFTGSEGMLRFVLERCSDEEGERLAAVCWQGEFCSDATPQEEKTTEYFPFTAEGVEQAEAWLNRQCTDIGKERQDYDRA